MVAAMEDACDQGVTEACDGLSREEEAKRAWLAKMDKPSLFEIDPMASSRARARWQSSRIDPSPR